MCVKFVVKPDILKMNNTQNTVLHQFYFDEAYLWVKLPIWRKNFRCHANELLGNNNAPVLKNLNLIVGYRWVSSPLRWKSPKLLTKLNVRQHIFWNFFKSGLKHHAKAQTTVLRRC